MNKLAQFWKRLTTSTEVALLRAEARRLRETNFALEEELGQSKRELRGAVNSILVRAGAPPLEGAEEVKAPSGRVRNLTFQQQQRIHTLQTAAVRTDQATKEKSVKELPKCGYCGGAHVEKYCLLKRAEG